MFVYLVPACKKIDWIYNCYSSEPICEKKKMKFEGEVDGTNILPRNFYIFMAYVGILVFLIAVVVHFSRRKRRGKTANRAQMSAV